METGHDHILGHLCHCERSEAISVRTTRLPRPSFLGPRNDRGGIDSFGPSYDQPRMRACSYFGPIHWSRCHCEGSEERRYARSARGKRRRSNLSGHEIAASFAKPSVLGNSARFDATLLCKSVADIKETILIQSVTMCYTREKIPV